MVMGERGRNSNLSRYHLRRGRNTTWSMEKIVNGDGGTRPQATLSRYIYGAAATQHSQGRKL